MENAVCKQCDFEQDRDFNFCVDCGAKMRCDTCGKEIQKNAKFCSGCGNDVNVTPVNTAMNTIKFRETSDERSYEVAFTNEAAKGVTTVLNDMLGNKGIGLSKGLLKSKGDNSLNDDDDLDSVSEVEIISTLKEEENKGDEFLNDLPHLNDLELKLGDVNEIDWVLLYAYYFSEYGKKHFTKEEVFEHYKDRRKTDNRLKNYKRTWEKSFSLYFKTLNEHQILINDTGTRTALGILRGEKMSHVRNLKPRKAKKVETNTDNNKESSVSKKAKSNTTAAKNIITEEFEAITEHSNLSDFFAKVKPVNNSQNILAIAYYIQKVLNHSYFTDGMIDYGFKFLKLDRQTHLRQLITNAKNNELWFTTGDIAKSWTITRKGEIELEIKLKQN